MALISQAAGEQIADLVGSVLTAGQTTAQAQAAAQAAQAQANAQSQTTRMLAIGGGLVLGLAVVATLARR